MGKIFGKWRETIDKAVEIGGDIAKEAVVDKDKLIEFKKTMGELDHESDKLAREMYNKEMEELKGPFINLIRAIVRPVWGLIGASAFGFECFTIVYGWLMKIKNPEIEMHSFAYPQGVHVLLMIIATFYFGSRFMEKKGKSKFFEKWGI